MTFERLIADFQAAPVFPGWPELMTASFRAAPAEGLVLEFGVGAADTTRHIAALTGRKVYGFDAFLGLPSDWDERHPKGTFDHGGVPPCGNLPANVELVKGWFDVTAPQFAYATHLAGGRVAFMHLDGDLYDSAAVPLGCFSSLLADGAVLNFNEFANYRGWEQHEAKAFHEFIRQGWAYECLGRTASPYCQAAFKVRRNGALGGGGVA